MYEKDAEHRPYAYFSKLLGCWFVVSRYVHPSTLAPIKCMTLDAVVRVAASMQRSFIDNPVLDEKGMYIDEGDWSVDCWNPHKAICVHGVKV